MRWENGRRPAYIALAALVGLATVPLVDHPFPWAPPLLLIVFIGSMLWMIWALLPIPTWAMRLLKRQERQNRYRAAVYPASCSGAHCIGLALDVPHSPFNMPKAPLCILSTPEGSLLAFSGRSAFGFSLGYPQDFGNEWIVGLIDVAWSVDGRIVRTRFRVTDDHLLIPRQRDRLAVRYRTVLRRFVVPD